MTTQETEQPGQRENKISHMRLHPNEVLTLIRALETAIEHTPYEWKRGIDAYKRMLKKVKRHSSEHGTFADHRHYMPYVKSEGEDIETEWKAEEKLKEETPIVNEPQAPSEPQDTQGPLLVEEMRITPRESSKLPVSLQVIAINSALEQSNVDYGIDDGTYTLRGTPEQLADFKANLLVELKHKARQS